MYKEVIPKPNNDNKKEKQRSRKQRRYTYYEINYKWKRFACSNFVFEVPFLPRIISENIAKRSINLIRKVIVLEMLVKRFMEFYQLIKRNTNLYRINSYNLEYFYSVTYSN